MHKRNEIQWVEMNLFQLLYNQTFIATQSFMPTKAILRRMKYRFIKKKGHTTDTVNNMLSFKVNVHRHLFDKEHNSTRAYKHGK